MIQREEYERLQQEAAEVLRVCGVPLSESELDSIAVADFGLSNTRVEGAQILTLFATERISAKLIVLLPGQTLPEHWHPPVGDDPGKEEILRGLWNTVYYIEEGDDPPLSTASVPAGKDYAYTCRRQIDLVPDTQVIIPPGRKHWMQGGPEGGCIFSFSTCVRDILDQFTDKDIVRTTKIID